MGYNISGNLELAPSVWLQMAFVETSQGAIGPIIAW